MVPLKIKLLIWFYQKCQHSAFLFGQWLNLFKQSVFGFAPSVIHWGYLTLNSVCWTYLDLHLIADTHQFPVDIIFANLFAKFNILNRDSDFLCGKTGLELEIWSSGCQLLVNPQNLRVQQYVAKLPKLEGARHYKQSPLIRPTTPMKNLL